MKLPKPYHRYNICNASEMNIVKNTAMLCLYQVVVPEMVWVNHYLEKKIRTLNTGNSVFLILMIRGHKGILHCKNSEFRRRKDNDPGKYAVIFDYCN